MKARGWGLGVMVAALLGGGVWWGWQTLQRIPLRHVSLVGQWRYVRQANLIEPLKPYLGTPYIAVPMHALQQTLRQNPWLSQVSLRRRWPDTLEVHVVERTVVARWGTHQLLDTQGQVFTPPTMPVDLANLLRLSGPEGTQIELARMYESTRDALAQKDFSISALSLDQAGNWTFTLNPTLTLVVDGQQPLARLQRLLAIYPQLHTRLDGASRIDLRYANGFAVAF